MRRVEGESDVGCQTAEQKTPYFQSKRTTKTAQNSTLKLLLLALSWLFPFST